MTSNNSTSSTLKKAYDLFKATKLKRSDQFKILVRAGIYSQKGELTKPYGGHASTHSPKIAYN